MPTPVQRPYSLALLNGQLLAPSDSRVISRRCPDPSDGSSRRCVHGQAKFRSAEDLGKARKKGVKSAPPCFSERQQGWILVQVLDASSQMRSALERCLRVRKIASPSPCGCGCWWQGCALKRQRTSWRSVCLKIQPTEAATTSGTCFTCSQRKDAKFQGFGCVLGHRVYPLNADASAGRTRKSSVSLLCLRNSDDVACCGSSSAGLQLRLWTEEQNINSMNVFPFDIFQHRCPLSRRQRALHTHASFASGFVDDDLKDENEHVKQEVTRSDLGRHEVADSLVCSGEDTDLDRLRRGNGFLDNQGDDGVTQKVSAEDGNSGSLWQPGISLKSVYPDDVENGKHEGEAKSLEAVVVLAGGQVPGGGVPVWVERRLDLALQIQNLHGPSCKIVLSGGGTPYRPPQLTSEGFVIHESTSCVNYLRSKGVDCSIMLKEWSSYDTIGNGYLSLTQHVIPSGWRRIAVVTSAFHMPRSKAVFEWIFGLQGAGMGLRQRRDHETWRCVPTERGSRREGFLLEYHDASDDGIDKAIIGHRIRKEHKSLESLQLLISRIHTLSDFHQWFHSEHKAYNIYDQDMFGRQKLDDPAVLSY